MKQKFVEAAGIEPASEYSVQLASTCLGCTQDLIRCSWTAPVSPDQPVPKGILVSTARRRTNPVCKNDPKKNGNNERYFFTFHNNIISLEIKSNLYKITVFLEHIQIIDCYKMKQKFCGGGGNWTRVRI